MDDVVGVLHDGRFFSVAKLFEEGIELRFSNRAIVFATDLDGGCFIARIQALDLFEGKHAVRSGLAVANAKFGHEIISQIPSTVHMATKTGADLNLVLAGHVHRIVKRIKRCNALNFGETALQSVCDFCNCFTAQITAVFALSQPETRKNASLLVRIVADKGLNFLDTLLGEFQLNIFWSKLFGSVIRIAELNEFAHAISFA